MKFVHAADLHLDSPLRGLERYEGAPVERVRGATREALTHLVDLCLEERADFLLLVGDLFDGSWRDYSTGLFFARQMARLREAATPVILIRGNHDAESQITRNLKLPENVHELATQKPETDRQTLAHLGVALHGQGFATRAVTDDLAARYPAALPDHFNLGLLHTSLDGREGHEPYAPTSLPTLAGKGYDYWALGHVHTREVVCRDPWVVYPGNLQGRHVRETGAKGATVVSVEDHHVALVEHRPLDVLRWVVREVDVAAAGSADDVLGLARLALEQAVDGADGRAVALRLSLRGATRAHAALRADPERWENELRAQANDVGGGSLWLERVGFDTRTPIDLDAVARRDDALGELVRSLRQLRGDDAALSALVQEFGDLRARLRSGRDGGGGEGPLRLDDPAWQRALVDDVEQILVPRLLESLEDG